MPTDFLDQLTKQLIIFFNQYVLVQEKVIQFIIITLILLLSLFFNKKFQNKATKLYIRFFDKYKFNFEEKIKFIIEVLTLPLLNITLLLLYTFFAINFSWPYTIISTLIEILIAWISIRLMSSFFKNIFMVRLFSLFILLIVILKIMNIYDRTITILDNIALKTTNFKISLLLVIQGIFLISIFIWIASKLTSFLERKIKNMQNLTPSLQVLFSKFTRFLIFGFAITISLNSLGLDLTAFTVLSGAIGVGIGFGLQNIVSNFISGIIILIDKSVKPGDVIEIDDTYGWISSLNARFVSIVTLNGEEHLIPNEDFITKKVVNLSYSDKLIRMEVSIGISYNSDVEHTIKIIEEVARNNKRICSIKEPTCLLMGFGDSTIDLELRFWINDPEKGLENIKSQIRLAIWKSFKENNIEVPFPQQDLHLKSMPSELEG